ncbi:MAG: metalloprotease [Thermoplasmata archaeon]|nr:metalloprotease [Thermoplasmata archaeon]
MRGPYSDYAAPPIYLTRDNSGPRPGVHFSRQELFQLGVAILALSGALTLAEFRAFGGGISSSALPMIVGLLFTGALVAVTTGVGLHEIAHKIVAQRYGHWAEFRYNLRGLGLAFVFAFFGFLIGAPGATWISGNVTKEQNGRISAAGPASNLVIGSLFLIAATTVIRTFSGANPITIFLGFVFGQAFTINVVLAGFNMIPILPFDGAKVWVWNKAMYVGIIVLAVTLYIVGVYLRVNAF